jgi:ADP-ribosylglycohydrolase
MRIAPVGIVCAGDPGRAAALAAIDAQISHARDGIWAAQAVAASVAVAMTGAPVEAVIAAGRDQIPADSWLGRTMARAMAICEESACLFDAFEQLHTRLWTPVHSMAAEAIPQAYGVFRLTGGDFRNGMVWAGNFGRDADTISAVVGALCGALQGERAIPAGWADKVDRPAGVCLKFAAEKSMRSLAQQLIALKV